MSNNIPNYLLIGLIVVMIVGFTLINYKTTEESVLAKSGSLSEKAFQSQYTIQDSSGKILNTNANF